MISALGAWERARVESVRAWLFTIAGNKAIDEERRASRRPGPEGEVDSWPSDSTVGFLEDPVWDEVRALPEKQRTAVMLVYGDGLSHGEAAKVMDCAESTVSFHLHAARKQLKKIVEQEGEV